MWSKLNNELTFTTFRYPRKDRDWEVEEVVQIVYKPRTKERKPLGIARIIRKNEKNLNKNWSYYSSSPNTPDMITPDEAYEDGFSGMHGGGDREAMVKFIKDWSKPPIVNKLTLYWIEKF